MSYTLAAARPESGARPRGKKQERYIGPIDSDIVPIKNSELNENMEIAHPP